MPWPGRWATIRIWQLPLGATNDLTPGEVERIWILEVDGQRLVIDSNGPPSNGILQGVLDSITSYPSPEPALT
ncbi:MAG TPA: hypothetical protein VIK32_09120 [Candidatus Limnocylindrales bacterium]